MSPRLYWPILPFLLLLCSTLTISCEELEKEQRTAARNTNFSALLQLLSQGMNGEKLSAPPIIYRDSINIYSDEHHYKRRLQYKLQIAERPLGLRCRTVQLRNPFEADTFPLAPSIVYQNHLVALFAPGHFACFQLPDFKRDTQLEEQLNDQLFERHQTFNNQLIGWSKNQAYYFNTSRRAWQLYTKTLPFNQWPKLFEDERYVCSRDCHGEFGGSVYFFDKLTKRTTRTEATCATAVWNQDGHYQVLASLGHMLGSARRGIIQRPEALSLVSTPRNPAQTWEYDLYGVLPDPTVQRVFDFSTVLMPGAFRWQNQTFYLVDWRNATFVATVEKNQITIVDPLFNNSLETRHAITTTYPDNITLTTIPRFYAQGREAACLLMQNGAALQVEWSKRHKLPY